MQAILGLIPHAALRAVDDIGRHFLAAMRGQAVEEDRFRVGLRYQERTDGESGLRSFIDETGDMVLLAVPDSEPVKIERREHDHEQANEKRRAREESQFVTLVRTDPTVSMRTLQAEMKMGRPKVKKICERLGYEYENGEWTAPPALKSRTEVSVDSDAVEDEELAF